MLLYVFFGLMVQMSARVVRFVPALAMSATLQAFSIVCASHPLGTIAIAACLVRRRDDNKMIAQI